ncbi:hypothetical protein RSK20926_03249 [Roseobacter sp. SK209-2-6]|nr:hypothetical protein RSK20926_03249 [Roseobacter sp. SK209-2-6]
MRPFGRTAENLNPQVRTARDSPGYWHSDGFHRNHDPHHLRDPARIIAVGLVHMRLEE